jgi:hypothetical protein
MTPHAEILSVLAAEFPKWVPSLPDVGGGVEPQLGFDARGWFYWGTLGEMESAINAHAHIERAAWGVVRWWCSKNLGSMSVSEGNPILIGFDSYSGDSRKDVWLGSGPTDADALLAALKYIAGEMGKESGR